METKDKGTLVLGLKEYEVVTIGEDICLYLHKVRGNYFRLVINAPKEIKIQRLTTDGESKAPKPLESNS